ncbi:MAG: radical SAM protein [Elusimicrobia bacterium]|nr:radical SAM protein [Candidatus Liberimonas magnetica]
MNNIKKFLEKESIELEKKAIPKRTEVLPPEEIHFELTYKCNSKCIMCNLRYLNKKDKELTLKDLEKLVLGSDLLKNIKFVVLSGGEALLRKDFLEIFKFFSINFPDANILILSNFLNKDLIIETLEQIKPLIDPKRLSLGTSLDGLESGHDKIRGIKKGFYSLTSTMKAVREIFPQIYFSLNFTITPQNCGQILPSYNWCKENNYHISYQIMVQKKETEQFIWKPEHISIIENQIDEIISDIYENSKINNLESLLSQKGLFSYLLSLHYIPKYVREKRRFYPNCPCGQKFAMIDPYGNLYFCPVHKDKAAGNLKKYGFDDIWVSGKSRQIRDFFDKKTCHCWLTCTNGYMLEDAIRLNPPDK